MRRGSTLLLAGGVLVVGLVAVALVLVLGRGTGGEPRAGSGADVADGAGGADGDGAAPRRDHVTGSGSIFGVVVRGAERAPAVGQTVSLAGVGGAPRTAVTDADGAFRFAGLPAGGPYELTAAAPGYATVRLPGLALARDERRDVGTLVLDAAVRVIVRVRTWSDAPVAGARVAAFTAPQTGGGDDWTRAMAQMAQAPVAVRAVTSDADGEAVFPELSVGRWTFVADKPGYARSGRAGLSLRRRDGDPDPITLRLEPGGALAGRVLEPTGDPVAGAIVLGARLQDSWNPQSAPLAARDTSGDAGAYALSALPAGPLVLRVLRKGAPPVTVATVLIPDVRHIDLVLREGGTVTGRVTVREDGSPVAGAQVKVSTWSSGGAGTAHGTTDEEGRYVVGGVPLGHLGTIEVEAEGWARGAASHQAASVTPGVVIERDIEMVPAARVTGRVSGPEGPVAGAHVRLIGGDLQTGLSEKSAETGPDGRFSIEGLTPGVYVALAGAHGWHQADAPGNPWMELQSGGEGRWAFRVGPGATHEIVLELVAGVTVTGTVLDESGDPLADVRLGLEAESRMVFGRSEAPHARSAEDGTFVLSGVPRAAALVLTASSPARVVDGAPPRLDTRDGEDLTDVVVRMRHAPVVAGRVVGSDGSPVPHAYVQVAWEETHDPGDGIVVMQGGAGGQDAFARVERHPVLADGAYEVPLRWAGGRIRVRAVAPGHAPATSEHVPLTAGRDRYEVDLQMLSGAALRGHVVAEETGAGLGGAHVTLSRVQPTRSTGLLVLPGPGDDEGTPIVAVTEPDGSFAAERLEVGTYRVAARLPGRVRAEDTVRAPADDVVLALAAALTIEGVVVDASGEGVAGLTVAARRSGGAAGTPTARIFGVTAPGSVVTDAQGRFTVRDLAAGTYTLEVSAEWGAPVSIRTFSSPPVRAGTRGVRLTVQSGAEIAGRVLDEDDQPVAGAMITLQGGQQWRHAQSTADGSFTFGGLPPGVEEYTLQVHVQTWTGRSLRPVHRNVRAGERSVEIRMLAGLSIEGRVRREDGAPLPGGASVTAEPLDTSDATMWMGWNHAEIDAEGRFRLGGLGVGAYRLRLDASDDGRALVLRGDGRVTAGATGLDLVAWFGARITGRVRAEGGGSLDGASIQAVRTEGGNVTSAPVAPNGSFEITGLVEGAEYDVTAQATGWIRETAKAVAGQAAAVELTVRPGATATGRILDVNGEPLTAAQLWVSGPGSFSSMAVQTDADGRFELTGLEPDGEYTVSVFVQSADGFSARPAGTIRGGQRDAVLQLQREEEE